MSRMTQYIGLTKKSIDFTKNLVVLPHNPEMAQGMFMEPIPGKRWKDDKGNIF